MRNGKNWAAVCPAIISMNFGLMRILSRKMRCISSSGDSAASPNSGSFCIRSIIVSVLIWPFCCNMLQSDAIAAVSFGILALSFT